MSAPGLTLQLTVRLLQAQIIISIASMAAPRVLSCGGTVPSQQVHAAGICLQHDVSTLFTSLQGQLHACTQQPASFKRSDWLHACVQQQAGTAGRLKMHCMKGRCMPAPRAAVPEWWALLIHRKGPAACILAC